MIRRRGRLPGRLGCLALVALVLCSADAAAEGSFDLGLGLGFADLAGSEGFDGGWDVQLGYEWTQRQTWHVGVQLHVLAGWTSSGDVISGTDMSFDSIAANVTLRPKKRSARWIQLKTGLVHADYQTATIDESGIGFAAGFGFVLGSQRKVRFHLLDYSRYVVGGDSFNVYSIGFILFGH